MTKPILRQHIANDDLEQVVKDLLAYAEQHQLPELRSDALIQSGRLEECKKLARRGGTSQEVTVQTRNAIRADLLEIVENLPDTPPLPGKPPKQPGMSERQFKLLVFVLMALGKAFIILFMLFQWETGGFSPDEAFSAISLLLPVFTAYLSVMLGEYVARRDDVAPGAGKRISRTFQWIAFVALPLYFLLLYSLVAARARGSLEFKAFTVWLTLVESGFGVYVGQIVYALFKTEGKG